MAPNKPVTQTFIQATPPDLERIRQRRIQLRTLHDSYQLGPMQQLAEWYLIDTEYLLAEMSEEIIKRTRVMIGTLSEDTLNSGLSKENVNHAR